VKLSAPGILAALISEDKVEPTLIIFTCKKFPGNRTSETGVNNLNKMQ
jgi:hypothetical protein